MDTRDVMRGEELLQRYEQTRSLPDLVECLELYRSGLRATPDDDFSRPGCLHNLAVALHAWFERTGDPAAMAEAVDASRQAARLVARGHPARAQYLNTLGNGLRAMFDLTGDPRFAAEAVDIGREVLAAVPAGHPARSMFLNGLAGTLCRSFSRSGRLPDLTEAADLARRAVGEVAHFACHGLADRRWPVLSSLILHDHRTRPLILADVTALHLTGALAYLSACATAAPGSQLADEAVHLTGAFHLAGYQNVIGTLWPVDDHAAERIAADFYAHVTRGGRVSPDTSLCAEALHHAVRGLRADFPASPALWAAHTHTGV